MSDEPFIVVDAAAAAPPFQQIVDQLRALVQSGELRPGTALPSVRQLAGDLRVAPNTVARAYSELQEDGWIEADARRGTRVATVPPAAAEQGGRAALSDAIAQFIQSLVGRGYSHNQIGEAMREAVLLAKQTGHSRRLVCCVLVSSLLMLPVARASAQVPGATSVDVTRAVLANGLQVTASRCYEGVGNHRT